MLKKILMTVAITALVGSSSLYAASDDYHNYGEWNIDGMTSIYDIGGYVDDNGLMGGANGDEYVIFNNSSYGYVYRVTVNGDPNAHPDAPNGQPIADRNFTFVSKSPNIGGGWGSAEFYVDDTGIYYGNGAGIKHWNHDWTNERNEITPTSPVWSETLAKNDATGDWWTATGGRQVYKYNKTTQTWALQFTYPDLGGSHQDGMEIVNDKLYLSDMTTDKIIAYDINTSTGNVIPDSNKTYTYTATSVNVEGMGFGPNQHFWMSDGKAYEVGDGKLTPPCTQTFIYNTTWIMDTSKCNKIKVPGIEDAVMVKLGTDGDLLFSTADAGAKAWLESRDFKVTHELELNTGEGFWTFAKSALSQTITTGKLRNNYLDLKDGVYTFLGFNYAVDLDTKFAGKPVEEIRYYDTKWHLWKPSDGSQNIPAKQGMYVLPNGDFSILMK